jgi:hypothetical protein
LAAIVDLQENRDFGKLLRESFDGDLRDYKQFSDQYFMSTGVFFDGTNNNKGTDYHKDADKDASTNVARMIDLYKSKDGDSKRKYIKGIGTDKGEGKGCLATGCNMEPRQQEAAKFILDQVINHDDYKKRLFAPVDVTGFSRGATTSIDFINNINNENYFNHGVMTRSALLFDPVGSYGVAGNKFDYGRDYRMPENVIAVQINAKNERRVMFDLQDLRTSDGKLKSPNWHVIDLPGVHATIGGGYKEGEQGSSRDMAFYAMQLMTDKAKEYGVEFKDIPVHQKPSEQFNSLMGKYHEFETGYQSNPTITNKAKFDSMSGFMSDIYGHDSSYKGTGKLENIAIGDREVYNPNDRDR